MSTRPDSAVDHSRAMGPPPVSRARWSLPSNQRGDITQLYLSSKSRFWGCGIGVLVPGVIAVDRVARVGPG